MNDKRKWGCEYCTYQNFPASKKCVLCHAPRQPDLITDIQNAEQDIYKVAAQMSQGPSNMGVSSLVGTTACGGHSVNKWACVSCTYLNWMRAKKCIQCNRPRTKSPSPLTGSPSQEVTKALEINTNLGENETDSGKSTPNRNSPISPEAARDANNDINKTYAKVSQKWTCKSCTYENWPKSSRCIICSVPKGKGKAHLDVGTISAACGGNSEAESQRLRRGRASPLATKKVSDTPQIDCQQDGATAGASSKEDNKQEERRLRRLRKRLRDKDWLWLNACMGVADGDSHAVEAYLTSSGDPARPLTAEEVTLLNRPSAFEVGFTLVHLAIRFQREDMLAVLLTATDVTKNAVKRLPSHSSPDLASDIRREIAASLRQRKAVFPCSFLSECVTFSLPADIEDLPQHIQNQLFDELLDSDVQKELVEELVINWSTELTQRLGSRLYALWNRTAGDCLLDSVLQATYGIDDIENSLRRALADSLTEGAMMFYPRWKEYESMQAETMQFSLDESQCQHDWAILLSLASQPGASLEQTHIFALAHILRRPIIVYGVKLVKSFRGETIGYARFQGIYLPLLWERSFCYKTPIILGYTRGHFSALVPMETDTNDTIGAGANIDTSDDSQVVYLPLVDEEGKLLPVHFLLGSEIGHEESIVRDWMDCCLTKGGLLVSVQKLGKRPLLAKQMVDEWLDYYRQLSHLEGDHPSSIQAQTFSSDGESDQE